MNHDDSDELLPAEVLRRRRADRRAAKRRMFRRALRHFRSLYPASAENESLAQRHADNMAICSCHLCRGDKAEIRPASEERRIARVEPEA